MLKVFVALVCLVVLPYSRAAHVVINEIMYHPPDDQNTLQYIELFNPTAAAVDLSGWKISGGVKYTLPAKTSLPAGGFLVIARDTVAVQRAYGSSVRVLGNFTGKLSHKGEKVELADASGQLIEKLHFHDKAPWPLGPDGYGSSLERICVDAPAEDPQNWSASEHPGKGMPGGSPGESNSVASAKPLPVVQNVKWERLAKPSQPLEIGAEVSGGAGIDKVVLEYRTVRAAKQSQPVEVPMQPVAASGSQYTAQIPAQPAGTLVRFTIRATDKQGISRMEPGAGEPRPAFSSLFTEVPQRGRIPQLTIINPAPMRAGANRKFEPSLSSTHGPGKSAAFYVPPQGDPGEPQLFDFVQVRRRAGGWKVHFFKDQRLDEMTGINVIFEGPPRWVLAEHLSYELYRKAGMKIEKSGHVRLTVDGRMVGYYLFVEQPNKNFLARSGRDETGNLYKVQWFGRNVIDQHEKKTNPGTGHDDIIQLIQNLRQKSGAAQWAYINEQFDVDAWANYYAVNMCIENWDGFFNNHFIYHDLKPGGKWDVVPWDEDKTWGEYDGCPQDYSWYNMPLTMGMNGDPSGRGGGGFFGGGPFGGGAQWWRPGSMISGALLANAQFRQKFEARLRELCNTIFSEEKFGPVVQALQEELRSDVELKARAAGQDPTWTLKQFDAEMASFHRQLVNRRKYILANLK